MAAAAVRYRFVSGQPVRARVNFLPEIFGVTMNDHVCASGFVGSLTGHLQTDQTTSLCGEQANKAVAGIADPGRTRNPNQTAASPVRHAIFTIRNLTPPARRIIERSVMNVIKVKRTVTRRTPQKAPSIRRSFRKLARDHFAREKNWEFAIELIFFALIVAISAWPIFVTAGALSEFLLGGGAG
jgi:hypothetical protein